MRHIHKRWLGRKYRLSLSKADKEQFELKILAEKLFKNKKKSYARSLGPKFEIDRLGEDLRALKQVFVANIIPSGESIMVRKIVFLFTYNLIEHLDSKFWKIIFENNFSMRHQSLNMIVTVISRGKGF